MASTEFSAPPNTEISYVDSEGRTKHIAFDAKGTFKPTRTADQEKLDELAALKSHPVSAKANTKE